MKTTNIVRSRSRFWSRLLGSLIAIAMVALLVFGGVSNLMSELSEVYDALAASQAEAALNKARLNDTARALAHTQSDLGTAMQANQRLASQVQAGNAALAVANADIGALTEERNDLKRGLREAVQILAQTDHQYKAAIAQYRKAKAELERIERQPKLSVVMTTERYFAMSQRERFATSQQRFFAESDAGTLYYASADAFHEKEQHAVYSERSQVVLTQTGPGDDVLRCLRDGCAAILAAQQSSLRMERHTYQAQMVSSEMLLTEGRRGRRPGRRR